MKACTASYSIIGLYCKCIIEKRKTKTDKSFSIVKICSVILLKIYIKIEINKIIYGLTKRK
jgi:hypothetical protein